MARPPHIRDEDIIQAAREIFLRRGVRATTAEVAERAGVSEGIVFRRFKTKEALFRAALSPNLGEPPELERLLERVGEGTVEENLHRACCALIESLRVRVPFAMLSWSNPADGCLPDVIERGEHPSRRALQVLSAYADSEVRLGRLRRIDPEVFASAVVGSVMNFVMSELIRPLQRTGALSVPVFVRGLVDVLLHGAEPAPETRASPRRRAAH